MATNATLSMSKPSSRAPSSRVCQLAFGDAEAHGRVAAVERREIEPAKPTAQRQPDIVAHHLLGHRVPRGGEAVDGDPVGVARWVLHAEAVAVKQAVVAATTRPHPKAEVQLVLTRRRQLHRVAQHAPVAARRLRGRLARRDGDEGQRCLRHGRKLGADAARFRLDDQRRKLRGDRLFCRDLCAGLRGEQERKRKAGELGVFHRVSLQATAPRGHERALNVSRRYISDMLLALSGNDYRSRAHGARSACSRNASALRSSARRRRAGHREGVTLTGNVGRWRRVMRPHGDA